jgi:hypothetical protein
MRRLRIYVNIISHLLLSGGFFASATYYFRDQAYVMALMLALAGLVCLYIGIDTARENFGE